MGRPAVAGSTALCHPCRPRQACDSPVAGDRPAWAGASACTAALESWPAGHGVLRGSCRRPGLTPARTDTSRRYTALGAASCHIARSRNDRVARSRDTQNLPKPRSRAGRPAQIVQLSGRHDDLGLTSTPPCPTRRTARVWVGMTWADAAPCRCVALGLPSFARWRGLSRRRQGIAIAGRQTAASRLREAGWQGPVRPPMTTS